MGDTVGVAMVGAGAFGEFCLKAFASVENVRLVAIVDANVERAERLALQYNTAAFCNLETMLEHRDVGIVTLSTPPYLHAEQGLAALKAGKHLFCEKPLALTVEDGERMTETAREKQVHLTVNYVMRHNPYWQAAARLAQSGVLGALRHMDLENHAAGLSLPDKHWFWNKQYSGGIWIEHGVHFFDAFAWMSGQPGEVLGAASYRRSDGAVDRVEAILRYGEAAAHCYHGFDQSGKTEQTTVRLTFANGYLTLREWVPTSLELLTMVEQAQWERFMPGTINASTLPTGQTLAVSRLSDDKSSIYTKGIQSGIRELAQAVLNPGSPLSVQAEYGVESLRTAVAAEQMGARA